MNLRARNLLGRSVIGAAAIAAAGIVAPALAAAAPVATAPSVNASVTGSTISVTVQNTNTDPTVTCGAAVVLASKIGELETDPSKLLTPGFAAYRTPNGERVAAAGTATFTTPDLNSGAYAALGECTSSAAPGDVVTSKEQIVTVPSNAIFGSLQNGALENLLEFVTEGSLDGLINALTTGSSLPPA